MGIFLVLIVTLVAAKEEEGENKEKIITATKKGVAVLDHCIPEQIKLEYHVLQLASLVLFISACNKLVALLEDKVINSNRFSLN